MSDLSIQLEAIFSEFKTNLDKPYHEFDSEISTIARQAHEAGDTDVYTRAREIRHALRSFQDITAELNNRTKTKQWKEEMLSRMETTPICKQADLNAELLSLYRSGAKLSQNPRTVPEREASLQFDRERELHWSNRKDQDSWPTWRFEQYAPLIRSKGLTSSKIPQEKDYGVINMAMHFERPLSTVMRSPLRVFHGSERGGTESDPGSEV